MIADIPLAACAEPDRVAQALGMILIFLAGLIGGVTLGVVFNKPERPWWSDRDWT